VTFLLLQILITAAADFNTKKYMVTSVPTTTTLTITMASVETGSGATLSGGIKYFQYYHVGPAEQLGAYGWGISQFGGIKARSFNVYFKWSTCSRHKWKQRIRYTDYFK
jgi:hypothetical protein